MTAAIKVKICGVTLPDDAAYASSAGADFIGINLWPKSKRYVDPARAPLLAAAARAAGAALIVGVFVDADVAMVTAAMQLTAFDVIQVHGDESPATVAAIARATKRPVWKALAAVTATELERWPADAILLDAPTPGSGQTFDWTLARDVRRKHPARLVVLAGGLAPHNVADAITAVRPWAVDTASGVEAAPGVKDPKKIADFIAAAHLIG